MSIQNKWNNFRADSAVYFEKNRRMLTYAGAALVLLIGLGVFYKLWWQPKREEAASVKLAKLHHYFDNDSFDVVINGIKARKIPGAPEIADQYGWTQKGREAALMAGIAYLKIGK